MSEPRPVELAVLWGQGYSADVKVSTGDFMPPKRIMVKCPVCEQERMARPPREKLCVPCRNRINSPKGSAARSAASDQRTKEPLYNVWKEMRGRCGRETHPRWARYGGRGIAVCDEWQDWKTFREWAHENGYKVGLHLDRVDNDGDYRPDNCMWMSKGDHLRKTWAQDRNREGVIFE